MIIKHSIYFVVEFYWKQYRNSKSVLGKSVFFGH